MRRNEKTSALFCEKCHRLIAAAQRKNFAAMAVFGISAVGRRNVFRAQNRESVCIGDALACIGVEIHSWTNTKA